VDPTVWQLEKTLKKAQLVHDLERGWVNRIAAEIAQEVRVLLENHNLDACSRQEEPKEHSRRPSSDNAAFDGNLLAHLALLLANRSNYPDG